MKKKSAESKVYWLVFADNFLEDHPSFISCQRWDDHGFDTRLMSTGNSIRAQWPTNFTLYVSGSEPVDYFICGAYYQAVSGDFKKVLSSLKVEGVEFLPIQVIQEETGTRFQGYSIMNVTRTLDALDWEHTNWGGKQIPYEDPYANLDIITPALKAGIVEGIPIFRLRVKERIRPSIYVSALLYKELEREEAKVGIEFYPIKVVDS